MRKFLLLSIGNSMMMRSKERGNRSLPSVSVHDKKGDKLRQKGGQN